MLIKCITYSYLFMMLILLLSCHPSLYKSVEWQPKAEHQEFKLHSVFYQDTSSHGYDVQIHVQKKYFSGLLFFKLIDTGYRFSMVTKTGQNLIDLTIVEDEMIVHDVLPELNKKVVLEQLRKDFQLLIVSCDNSEFREYGGNKKSVFIRSKACSLFKQEYAHFEFAGDDLRLIHLGFGSKNKTKLWARFSKYQEDVPQRITIDHHSLINLRLELTSLTLSQK